MSMLALKNFCMDVVAALCVPIWKTNFMIPIVCLRTGRVFVGGGCGRLGCSGGVS